MVNDDGYYMVNHWWLVYNNLVGGKTIPLKNDGVLVTVGMMTFPTEWKVIKFMFQTTNQIYKTYVLELCKGI